MDTAPAVRVHGGGGLDLVFLRLWHWSCSAQWAQPQPQAVLPCFLLRIRPAMIAAATPARISEITIVAAYCANHSPMTVRLLYANCGLVRVFLKKSI